MTSPYLPFTADILILEVKFIGIFADESMIISTNGSKRKAVKKLQHALGQFSSRNWFVFFSTVTWTVSKWGNICNLEHNYKGLLQEQAAASDGENYKRGDICMGTCKPIDFLI